MECNQPRPHPAALELEGSVSLHTWNLSLENQGAATDLFGVSD